MVQRDVTLKIGQLQETISVWASRKDAWCERARNRRSARQARARQVRVDESVLGEDARGGQHGRQSSASHRSSST